MLHWREYCSETSCKQISYDRRMKVLSQRQPAGSMSRLASWPFPTKGDALRAERMIKRHSRSHKLQLLDPACAHHPKRLTLFQSA